MTLQESSHYDAIMEYFDEGHGDDDAFLDVVADLLDRALLEKGDADEKTERAIDDGLIYDCDKWAILAHYCTPEKADYDYAEACFRYDMAEIVANVMAEAEDPDISVSCYAYYDAKERGLESDAYLSDATAVQEYVWEKTQRGFYVRVTHPETGETWFFTPDDTDPDDLSECGFGL